MTQGRFRVVVTDQLFPSVDLERRRLAEIGATLEVAEGDRADVLAQAAEADALLNTFLALDASALAELRRCRVVARYGIGVDNIDLAEATRRGIVVTNVPDYCVEEVAVHALALLLALQRRLPEGDECVRAGGWGIASLRPIERLSEQRVGLVGLGRIGRRLATFLAPLGVRVIVFDPYLDEEQIETVSLEELLETADAVSLHCPLTDETRGLIGAPQLARMQRHAVLVNVSRGPLVVLDDLIQALRDGVIRGAALDVFEQEPPDPRTIRDVPGLITTPHAAFYSESAIQESQRKAVDQIVKVLTGARPDYAVTP